MTDAQKEIREIFRLVSSLSVSGDVVDVMSEIRARLRVAYALSGPGEEDQDG